MRKPPFTTVVRRQLGRRLRTHRLDAGITPVDVARAKIAHRAKLWRYETGRATVRGGDVMAMCHLYRIDHDTTTDLVRMADASDERNYTEDHTGTENRSWMYADLESLATGQFHYSAGLVPDLLQTPAYAHAVITADTAVTTKDARRLVDHRILRQQAFFNRDEPGRLEIVMPAAVLDLPVGSTEITAEQIAHLIAAGDRDEVSIQILSGIHGCTDGSFTIMDFDDPDDPPVVCLTSLTENRYIERPQQVTRYRQAAELLRKRATPLAGYLRERRRDGPGLVVDTAGSR